MVSSNLMKKMLIRNVGGKEYQATTWQIQFEVKDVKKRANYTLQVALASANGAELQVRHQKIC